MFKATAELCDVISESIFCVEDNSYMLTLESTTNEFWIPSSKVNAGVSWQTELSKECAEIFGLSIEPHGVIRICKIWKPGHPPSSIYHCVYELRISMDLKKKTRNTFGKYRGKVRWVSETELQRLYATSSLKSPEIMEYYIFSKTEGTKPVEGLPKLASEIVCNGIFLEVNDKILVDKGGNIYEQIVDAGGINREAQTSLFREFLMMSFPALYLSVHFFSRFISELGWSKEDAPYLFKSADVNNRRGLSFREFLYFIAAVEPGTSHGGGPAELRCRYIFKFFDRDADGLLNFSEFKHLLLTVRKVKKQTTDEASIKQDAQNCYRAMGLPVEKAIGISEFLHAVGDLKLRGTSQIFRSGVSVQQYLKDLNDRERAMMKSSSSMPGGISESKKSMMTVETAPRSHKMMKYDIAMHTVRLQKSGTMIAVDQIWNLGAAVTFSSTHQPTLSDSGRRTSVDQFSQKTISSEILKSLRYLSQINKNKNILNTKQGAKKDLYSWGQLDPTLFGRNFITVCQQARDIMKDEPRMLELSSPIYVLGDLHGNFNDLLYFEKVLWHLGPCLCPSSLLFLGDYVDRGQFSIEVVAYLFSYKVQGPGKVKLLRGNHEIRDIQKLFTFYTECTMKFGDSMGDEVWNAVNSAFDMMPVAAVIDQKVFCCHGGIPPPWLCPVASVINTIPVPLNQPDEQSSLAWEIMWNDPVSTRHKNMTEAVAMELMTNDGFATNTRRGTAHIFSVEALEKFLNVNGFSHIIRAHEVAQAGFSVQQKGKLLTVFSSSKYCGGQNEAACVLADQEKLRILRLETS